MSITLVSSPVAIADPSKLAASANLIPLTADHLAVSFADLLNNHLLDQKPLPSSSVATLKDQPLHRTQTKSGSQNQNILDEISASLDDALLNQTTTPHLVLFVENLPTSSSKRSNDSDLPQQPDVGINPFPILCINPQPNPIASEPISIPALEPVSNSGPNAVPMETATVQTLASLPTNKVSSPYLSSSSNIELKTETPSSLSLIVQAPNITPDKHTAPFALLESASGLSPSVSVAPTPQVEAAVFAANTSTNNTPPPEILAIVPGNSTLPPRQTGHSPPSSVNTHLQDNRWALDFGEQIVWIAKNDQQIAQINISPAQLGPVQITLNLTADQANISFASPHAEVRKAIEDAMPNLREMLSSAGINLGQSNIGAQLSQQQRDTNSPFANGNRSSGETAILPADSLTGSPSPGLPVQRGRGMVDLFA